MKGQGDSHKKKRCCCSFTLKRFYLHPTIAEVSYTTFQHVNKLGLVVHGNVKSSYKSTFSALISKETRSFVLENLHLGLSIYQVMNKHKSWIKEIMENNGNLSRDFFLCEQDIRNMVGSLLKKPTRKMKMMFECGSLKTRKRFSSTKNLMFKSKETWMMVTCLSQLAYKLNGKRRWCYVMDMKVVCLLMLCWEQKTKR